MLNEPRLDDLDYRQLFERARSMIPTMTEEWTDFNDHDPGITTLQAFAWLCDNLNFYINATGEAHRLKYLKLLGIVPCREAATCRVAFSAPSGARLSLPVGTRLSAGDVPFELAEGLGGRSNELVRLYVQEGPEDAEPLDLTAFAGEDGSFARVFSENPNKAARALFGFESALEGELRLFVEVAPNDRNPFEAEFSLVELAWEAWDGESWQEAQVLSDETCGLLRSGFVTLALSGATAPLETEIFEKAHYLRAYPRQGCYDLCPQLGRVSLGCVTAVQTDTIAQSVEMEYDGSGAMTIDYAVGDDDLVSVAVAEGDVWREWYRQDSRQDGLCIVEKGETPLAAVIRFDEKEFGTAPKAGDKVLVTIVRDGYQNRLTLGLTDGCANQKLFTDTEDLYEIRLALVDTDRDGRRVMRLFEECEDLSLAGYDDAVFVRDTHEGCVILGDALRGLQPPAGLTVEAVTLKYSRLDAGNVMRYQINRVVQLEGEAESSPDARVSVINPESAAGGSRMRTSEELEPELEKKIRKVSRAVTSQDIDSIVMQTPGILVDSVAVIPMQDYCKATGMAYKPNTILVAVKPKSARRRPVLSEDYKAIVRRNLDRYRLITTDIRVIPARYVGVSVFGRILLTENSDRAKQRVLSELERIVDTEVTGEFGKRVDFGRLFSALEMCEYVKAVSRLSLEYTGAGGHKNEHGDIVLHPDSLSYLRETGIEFI